MHAEFARGCAEIDQRHVLADHRGDADLIATEILDLWVAGELRLAL
jgi:hypothetical protein